jgi:glycosyltransferase involved in cell wall biosynthesis
VTTSEQWKFLFVSAPFSGIEVFFKNIQLLIHGRNDIDSSWIWIERWSKELVNWMQTMTFNWTLKGGLLARARVRKLEHDGKRFDAVLFNHTIPAMFLLKFRKRVPMILSLDVTSQVLEPYNLLYRGRIRYTPKIIAALKCKLLQAVYNDAVHILAWSNLVRDSLIHTYGIHPDKVSVVPPGVDVRRWVASSSKNRHSAVRKQPIKILFVGGDFFRKGGDCEWLIGKSFATVNFIL